MRKPIAGRMPMPNVSGGPGRIWPGPHLSPKIAKVFEEITRASAPAAFSECDRPLLDSLATAIAFTRQAQRTLERRGLVIRGEINPLTRYVRDQQRIICTICTRLRISPQSRVSKEKAGANASAPTQPGDGLAALLALEHNRRAQ
jgi:hypothetical protein